MRAKRTIIVLILLYFGALVSSSAAAGGYGLIVTEIGEDSKGNQTETLAYYHFKGGTLVAKENILTTLREVRYDFYGNQIYKNRYVITRWGDVVDLATKKVLFKSRDRLVDIDKSSDSVIVQSHRKGDHGIYSFNLSSHKHQRIHAPGLWEMLGWRYTTPSPDGKVIAIGKNDEIWLLHLDGTKALLGTGFSRQGTPYCNSPEWPTFVWMDNTHLVTQRGNGNLVIVDVDGKEKPIVKVPDLEWYACGPALELDSDNQISYQGLEYAWLIDVANQTFKPYLWTPAGNGFDFEYQQNPSYGRVIRHNGAEIIRCWCDSASTAPGHVAVRFGPVGSELYGSKGLKVWSAENGQWTTLKPEWFSNIIGWIEE